MEVPGNCNVKEYRMMGFIVIEVSLDNINPTLVHIVADGNTMRFFEDLLNKRSISATLGGKQKLGDLYVNDYISNFFGTEP